MKTIHRSRLPQLKGDLFVTDGGLETTLIFHRGINLPAFAAFVLLKDDEGTEEIRRYYESYLALAKEHGAGFVLESPTWRASPRWAREVGYSDEELDEANRRAISLMAELRDRYRDEISPIVISGQIGPQDDGYSPDQKLSADQAADYHSTQIGTFAETEADMVTALTMTYADEAIGIARAAQAAGIPAAISFTLETDGKLPSGQPLSEAIEETDAATEGGPAYYMINCAHPTHFESVLGGSWTTRIRGLRANASTKSHAELDEATDLDDGDPDDLGARYAQLSGQLPELNVLGGCCGTDDRHVGQICDAWVAPPNT
ncbi:MAG TPA: homocysteine S-methyltransferase family protein [Solirubrobacterales bacterium]